MKSIAFSALLAIASTTSGQTQADKPPKKVLLCDENAGCAHQYIEGQKFKMLTGNGLTVIVSIAMTEKYTRADVSVFNGGTANIDVLPTDFHLEEVAPNPKPLAYVDAAKVIKSAQKRMAWGNALTAMGGSMARQQSTTGARHRSENQAARRACQ